MFKKGDTLIEVMLAIGIFSMIAISVVAVMSGSTSSAQTALETTLAREEIDAQAEALRYIHDSYINDKNSDKEDLSTIKLWHTITSNAVSGDSEDYIPSYTPGSCEVSEYPAKAFILDTRNLNTDGAYKTGEIFSQAVTYPQLRFGGVNNNELLTSDNASASLQSAEGIYVVAVADSGTTTIIDINGNEVEVKNPAFYDFYIRTCWYGSDDDTPSTISTVIRLHNPDITTNAATFNYITEDGAHGVDRVIARTKEDIPPDEKWPAGHPEGWTFDGWCVGSVSGKEETFGGYSDWTCNGSKTPTIPADGGAFITPETGKEFYVHRLYTHIKYTLKFNSNGSSWKKDDEICYQDENDGKCFVGKKIKHSGYILRNWCDGVVGSDGSCSGKTYSAGDGYLQIPDDFPESRVVYLTAMWEVNNETITIDARWTTKGVDYDSSLKLQLPNGSEYIDANHRTLELKTEYNGEKYSLVTGLGDGHCGAPWATDNNCFETYKINTLGGKNYYYSIRKFLQYNVMENVGNDITVTVSGETFDEIKFYSKDRKCSGNYWNVFGYVDGEVVERNTCSEGGMEYGYK